MYYIINQNNQIVAIDPQLLTQLDIPSADEFYKKVALNEIIFELDDNGVRITVDGKSSQYTAKTSPLDGMLGDIRLVDIDIHSRKEEEAEKIEENNQTALSMDEIDLFDIKEKSDELLMESPVNEEIEMVSSTESQNTDIDLFGIKEESDELLMESPVNEEIEMVSSTESQNTEEDDLFELILPTDAENAIADIETQTTEGKDVPENIILEESVIEETETVDNTPIYIDIEHISEKIGITPEDYNLFLNEYIDTALTFEEALQSNDTKTKEEALHTLSHLSNVLHLPFVGNFLEQIKNASLSEKDDAIRAFFTTLSRLTTSRFEENNKPVTKEVESQPLEEKEPSIPSEPEITEETRAPIDLSDIKPIHFDFQLQEAANDLSLPVELIEEFVNDFIIQAHEETEKMLKAYQKGDLETVQKIGHLLKGTSSNLRINPLSDTLYEIQFNEDIDRVPELVKNYWAHFLSLENQIELISKK